MTGPTSGLGISGALGLSLLKAAVKAKGVTGMADGPRFQPVQPVRAYQRIVEQVEDALVRGELAPGQRLPSERELVTQFAVSRSTVREALRVLESNGVVRSRPGDPNGPEILPFSSTAAQADSPAGASRRADAGRADRVPDDHGRRRDPGRLPARGRRNSSPSSSRPWSRCEPRSTSTSPRSARPT